MKRSYWVCCRGRTDTCVNKTKQIHVKCIISFILMNKKVNWLNYSTFCISVLKFACITLHAWKSPCNKAHSFILCWSCQNRIWHLPVWVLAPIWLDPAPRLSPSKSGNAFWYFMLSVLSFFYFPLRLVELPILDAFWIERAHIMEVNVSAFWCKYFGKPTDK